MNILCKKIKVPFEPLINFDVYNTTRKRNLNKQYSNLEYIPVSLLNSKLANFLDQRGLCVSLIDLFYCNPNQAHPIHVDQPHVDKFVEGDYVRLNWIYGGSDSEMKWYKFKDNAQRVDRHRVNHVIYNDTNVDCIHSQCITGTYIVQVGIPHTVQAHSEKRHAFCTDIIHKDTKARVTMSEALQIFSDILVAEEEFESSEPSL